MEETSEGRPSWQVILALVILPPLGWYWMWQTPRYDRWWPGLLWLVGLPALLTLIIQMTVVRPQMTALYTEFGAEVPKQTASWWPMLVAAGLAAIQIGYGLYLWRGINQRGFLGEKDKTGAVGLLVLGWVVGGFLQGMAVAAMIQPLYTMTSSLPVGL